jgi:hypothetical protein
MKQCKDCKEYRSLTDYYICNKEPLRHYSSCKECTRLKSRIKYANLSEDQKNIERKKRLDSLDRERAKARSTKHYSTVEGRAKILLKGVKDRDVSHDLDLQWFIDKLQVGKCEVTGIPFDFNPHPVYKKNPMSPSIDRINSSLGYQKENCRLVVWQYNMGKGETSDSEFLEFCRKLVSKYKEEQ